MIQIHENISLKSFNTLGIDVKARYLAYIDNQQALIEALSWANDKGVALRIIGGGSNIVLTQTIDALVLIMQTQGIKIIDEQGSQLLIEVEAGVVWHQLIIWAVSQGLGGIENLSLIPGTAGAAPVQNIGAYGVEFKDVCESVTVLNRQTGAVETLTASECHFAYRDSVFKHHPEQWIVLRVRIKLDRASTLHTNYAALQPKLANQTAPLTYAEVSRLVCETRQEKLPNPKQLGNAGSFFKNPIVNLEKAEQLKQQYPDLVVYPYLDKTVKLAAGWLIDKAGLKGYREGDVGTYPKQALVLVNYGSATGADIVAFSQNIQKTIKECFGVTLEPEPVFY